MAPSAHTPSPSLLANFRQELVRFPPFAQMAAEDVDAFVAGARQRYYAPDERVVDPSQGVVAEVYFIRQGAVTGTRGLADQQPEAFAYEAGDLFPLSAAMAQRAVTATYRASADTFVLALDVATMRALADRSAAFADFLRLRAQQFLALSRQALQAAYASQSLAEQSLETPLARIARGPVAGCSPQTPLREALQTMHQRRVGSVLVTGPGNEPLGILTRYDILGRVTLPGIPLDRPVREVMVSPVWTLTEEHTAQDAALLMGQHGIRHVPVTRHGAVVGVVSERDLFVLQRQSLKQVSSAIRGADSLEALQQTAMGIRRFARTLLGQGVQARQLTQLVSHLNDLLTQRLLALVAQRRGLDLRRLCWLALGSEGRNEQTIATDQDNALILADDTDEAFRVEALAFAAEVNEGLDACGFPLCKGGIMAREADCCLTLGEWTRRFDAWMAHGAPKDLLHANIFFDFRPLAGRAELAQALREEVTRTARTVPRFHQQLALNALQHAAPLNWLGAVDADASGGLDLKLQGTALFVDAARILALAQGIAATSTRDRLVQAGVALGATPAEYEAWASGFEFLQMLRMQNQLQGAAADDRPNWVPLDRLNAIDRRILRETFRVARALQQRLQMDYQR